jgi:hypothetical protein
LGVVLACMVDEEIRMGVGNLLGLMAKRLYFYSNNIQLS